MWAPLLTGALAERARQGASAIAESLRRLEGPEQLAPGYAADIAASLASGSAGLALSFAYLAEAGVASTGWDTASDLLASASQTVGDTAMDPDLFGGYTGVAWVASQLWPDSGETPDGDPLAGVDQEVLGIVEGPGREGRFDLVSGLVGFGIYSIERLPRPAGLRCLERIVDVLAATAESVGHGLTWKTEPSHLSPHQLRTSPDGHYDLGVAHGVPGVIGLLAQACAAGVGGKESESLLRGAVDWLLEQRRPGQPRFRYWTTPEGQGSPSRSAWCYGDPGVAAVLLLAARCTGETGWERAAVEIALDAASRPPEESGVVDASLCHGAAGLGHVFNRIYQRTGREEFRLAATSWFERTLGMCQPGTGHAGYTTVLKSLEGGLTFASDPSLLSGAAGIALTLASAATDIEPSWDRMLLLSSGYEK